MRTDIPCVTTDTPIRSHPPPTPFLQNAVKDSPGRGWGKYGQGNRTVTHIVGRECVFPQGGNAVLFFLFVFFSVRSGVFCRFLSFFSSKGRFFGKIFGSELLFLDCCVGLGLFGGFLLMFLLYFWRFVPETV